MTRDHNCPKRHPTHVSLTSMEQLVQCPPSPHPGGSAQYHHHSSHEPSLGSTAPASSGMRRSGPVLPVHYPSSSSQGSIHRRDMIMGWLMGKKNPDPRPLKTPLRPGVHGYRSSRDPSRTSYDHSGDISGMSTDQTRLSRSGVSNGASKISSSNMPHTNESSSQRYLSDSTLPTSEIKTGSTLLATDRNSTTDLNSFATDHEIFGALASKISGSKAGSVTGKENYSLSSRATSVGSTSPIIRNDEDVASPEQAKQLMEKGFRQYRQTCGRCTLCKLLVMAAFLGILGLMSYGAVVGVRGALGYGSVSAQTGGELEGPYENETIDTSNEINRIEDDDENESTTMPPKREPGIQGPRRPPILHRTTRQRNGPATPSIHPEDGNLDIPWTTPKPKSVKKPKPVSFVGLGVQDEECVTEVKPDKKVNERRCRLNPNTTIEGGLSCSTYMYCVDEQGYTLYECPCGQFFHPETLTCLPQIDGYYGDPSDCNAYWHCEVMFPNVIRRKFQCQPGEARDILEPTECRPKDTVAHCSQSE